MDPPYPATPPATKQDKPSSTQPAEDEVAASLLLLKEAAAPEGNTALQEDMENHLVPDESTPEVNMDAEKEALDKTLVVTSTLVEEFSADEALDDEEEKNATLEQKGDGDDDDDDDDDSDEDYDGGLEEEEVEEHDYSAVVITEEVRRCNRNNGREWICPELVEPGFATCLRHIIRRREAYQRFQLRKLQGSSSTSGSEANVEPKIEDAATSAAGNQEEAANPSSPRTAPSKPSKAGDPSVPDA